MKGLIIVKKKHIFLGECDFDVTFGNNFQCDNDGIILYHKTIITLSSLKITLYTSTGSIMSHLTSTMNEGDSILS